MYACTGMHTIKKHIRVHYKDQAEYIEYNTTIVILV